MNKHLLLECCDLLEQDPRVSQHFDQSDGCTIGGYPQRIEDFAAIVSKSPDLIRPQTTADTISWIEIIRPGTVNSSLETVERYTTFEAGEIAAAFDLSPSAVDFLFSPTAYPNGRHRSLDFVLRRIRLFAGKARGDIQRCLALEFARPLNAVRSVDIDGLHIEFDGQYRQSMCLASWLLYF